MSINGNAPVAEHHFSNSTSWHTCIQSNSVLASTQLMLMADWKFYFAGGKRIKEIILCQAPDTLPFFHLQSAQP